MTTSMFDGDMLGDRCRHADCTHMYMYVRLIGLALDSGIKPGQQSYRTTATPPHWHNVDTTLTLRRHVADLAEF